MKQLTTCVALFTVMFSISAGALAETDWEMRRAFETGNQIPGVYDPLTGGNRSAAFTDWMSWVSDGTRLSELSIPGAHDTVSDCLHPDAEDNLDEGCGPFGIDFTVTQTLSLRELLDSGIRWIDLRAANQEEDVVRYSYDFEIAHGDVNLGYRFQADVLQVVVDFLNDHPSETVLINVQRASGGGPSLRRADLPICETDGCPTTELSLGKVLTQTVKAGTAFAPYYKSASATTTLGDLRGKFTFNVSLDVSQTSTDECCSDDKWALVESHFHTVDDSFLSNKMYANDLAGSNPPWDWMTPLGVAVGNHSNPLHAFGEGMTDRTLEWLLNSNQIRTGIVKLDFPGPALIGAIIAHNVSSFAEPLQDLAKKNIMSSGTSINVADVFEDDFQTIFGNIAVSSDGQDGNEDEKLDLRLHNLQQFLNAIFPVDYFNFDEGLEWVGFVVGRDEPEDVRFAFGIDSDLVRGDSGWLEEWVDQNEFEIETDPDDYRHVLFLPRSSRSIEHPLQELLIFGESAITRARQMLDQLHVALPDKDISVLVYANEDDGIGNNTIAFSGESGSFSQEICILSGGPFGCLDHLTFTHAYWISDPRSNLPPTANAGGPYSVNEGGAVILSGLGSSDPDQSAASLTYDWDLDSNGSFETPGSNPIFSAAGLDGPTSRTVRLRVTDDHSLTDTSTATIFVDNVAPVVTASGAVIDEDGVATVSGTITDPGTPDTFNMLIHWGEGSPESYAYPAGTTAFAVVHPYLDDDPTGTPSDLYAIAITVADDDLGVGSADTSVLVNNVPPTASIDSITDEAGNAVGEDVDVVLVGLEIDLAASFADVGSRDTHDVAIDWADGTPNGTHTTSPVSDTHTYWMTGAYDILVTVTDDDSGAVTVREPVQVVDAAGAVLDAIEDLRDFVSDPGQSLASIALIQLGLDELDGNGSGQASNGALDMLEKSNWNVSLVKLLKAIKHLEQADPLTEADLSIAVSQLLMTSKSTVVVLLRNARENATKPNELKMLATAQELIANGDQFLANGDNVAAVESYRQALGKLNIKESPQSPGVK